MRPIMPQAEVAPPCKAVRCKPLLGGTRARLGPNPSFGPPAGLDELVTWRRGETPQALLPVADEGKHEKSRRGLARRNEFEQASTTCETATPTVPPNGLGVQLRPTATEAAAAPKCEARIPPSQLKAALAVSCNPLLGGATRRVG